MTVRRKPPAAPGPTPSEPERTRTSTPRLEDAPTHAYWKHAQDSTSPNTLAHGVPADQRFSEPTGAALNVPVTLESDPQARLLFLDTDVFADYGLELGPNGLVSPEHVREVTRMTALRARPEGSGTDAPDGLDPPAVHAVATRYHDFGKGFGTVRGDGRAALIGGPLAQELGQGEDGPAARLAQARVKGVPTGLAPEGATPTESHGTGALSAEQALTEALGAAFAHANGIHTNRVAAITGSPEAVEFVQRNRIDLPDGTTKLQETPRREQRANELIVGVFDRLAHSKATADRGGNLRETLDDLNYQLSSELGRSRLLPHPALFLHLLERKATEFADLYWLRAMHGSPTFDNIGWLELVDSATLSSLDRTHPTHRGIHTSPGFAKEPARVHAFSLKGGGFTFFHDTATPEERAQLASIDPKRAAEDALRKRMAHNLLETLGFDPAEARALHARHEGEVLDLLELVRRHAETPAQGKTWRMGTAESSHEVHDPARYDVFSALGALPGILAAAEHEEARVAALVEALHPVDPEPERDTGVAGELLAAAKPLLGHALQGLAPELARERLRRMADLGQRVSTPVPAFIAGPKARWVQTQVAAVQQNRMSPLRLGAEFHALVRASVRRGPTTPGAIAAGLREGTLPVDAQGRARLSSIVEYGARIEERSDGVGDLVRVALAGNPLQLPDLRDYRVQYSFQPDVWHTAEPLRLEDGAVVFDLPVSAPPTHILVSFTEKRPPNRRFDLDGMPFGQGHTPLLGVPAVDAELAAWAARKGQHRPGTPPERLQAALAPAAPPEPSVPEEVRTQLSAAASKRGARRTDSPQRLPNGGFALSLERADGTPALLVTGPEQKKVREVQGAVLDTYWPLCRELGLPLGEERWDLFGRRVQRFERGSVTVGRDGEARLSVQDAGPILEPDPAV